MNKYVLVCVFLFLINGCHNKESHKSKEDSTDKKMPTIFLTKDEINNLGDMKVGDLFILTEHKIPISPKSKKYKTIHEKLKRSKEQIIVENDDMLVVRLYGQEKHTQEKIQLMDVIYLFENNELIKGPVIKKNNNINIEYNYK